MSIQLERISKSYRGQAVVRDISLVRTRSSNGFDDVPVESVLIERVELIPAAATAGTAP